MYDITAKLKLRKVNYFLIVRKNNKVLSTLPPPFYFRTIASQSNKLQLYNFPTSLKETSGYQSGTLKTLR